MPIYVGSLNYRIAKLTAETEKSAPALVSFNEAMRANDRLREALQTIIEANDDFRKGMPDGWEGDPLQDACEAARRLVGTPGERR